MKQITIYYTLITNDCGGTCMDYDSCEEIESDLSFTCYISDENLYDDDFDFKSLLPEPEIYGKDEDGCCYYCNAERDCHSFEFIIKNIVID